MTSLFIKACYGEQVPRVPVWYMRQAGRAFPEYRKLKEHYDILTLATTPALARDVCMMPIKQLGVDAAILFADIVLVLIAMGVDLKIVDGVGPVIANPVRDESALKKLAVLSREEKLEYLKQSIGLIRNALPDTVPLIGFSGAPFTLACYLIEGKPSRDFIEARKIMSTNPQLWNAIMEKLTESIIFYLRLQARAGAQALQLFDSWAGYLEESEYVTYVLPYSQRIFASLSDLSVPRIHFGTKTGKFIERFSDVDCEVVGVDAHISLQEARSRIKPTQSLQGNLSPELLLGDWSLIQSAVDDIFHSTSKQQYIFNLGHGVLPETQVETLKKLTAYVQSK